MPVKKKDHFHSNEDKSRAVAVYASLGSFTRAAAVTGIPENTIRYWSKQEWFAEELRRVDRADGEELKSSFTRIAKRATQELEDRLESGDEVVTKDGTIVKKKIAGKELAIIAAVAADKRKQQMDEPQVVALQNAQEKLLNLMESFMRFANAKEIKQEKPDEREIPSLAEEIDRPSEGDSGYTDSPYEASGDTPTSPSTTDSAS
jgi:transposase-like protein